MKIRQTEKGVILEVFVKPRSRQFRIAVEGDEIVVFCRAQPVEGRVNRELVKELSRFFHKNVHIVQGLTSRQKLLLAEDAEVSEIKQALLQK